MNKTYTTIKDVMAMVIQAIEGTGVSSRDEFDVEGIASDITEWQNGALVDTADDDDFWAVVEAHCVGIADDIALHGVDGDTLRIVTAEDGSSAALHSETLGCWLPAGDARDTDNSVSTPADWQALAAQFDTAAAALAAGRDPRFWDEQGGQMHAVVAAHEIDGDDA